ncbi:MAG: type II toxin-antitoxin system prevent-host-death family antitoxin [Xanthomonadales bacterium]|nr:type II toxin-antitoxin system prevent-host-death family antitoxin [Xanthomonadales bacterium]
MHVRTRSQNLRRKTHLSALVERAAKGEEIIITRRGVPRARLVPLVRTRTRRKPANAMEVRHVAEDFDAPDPRIEAMFKGDV